METSTTTEGNSSSGNRRLAAVQEMAAFQRILFEVEREFVRTATTLIYRVGDIELKYLLCQHVWESAGHARFLRERGREMTKRRNANRVHTNCNCISNFLSVRDHYLAS